MERMKNKSGPVKFPELIFGIAGAVGVDINEIERSVSDALKSVDYTAVPIRVTKEIDDVLTNEPKAPYADLHAEITSKMNHANAVCRKHKSADTLMKFVIRGIQKHRASKSTVAEDGVPPEEKIISNTAYVIRQLKRPQEVELMRSVYGKQFVLISAYGSITDRKRLLEIGLKRSLPLNTSDVDIGCRADELMHRDQIEEDDKFGQNLRDTFHRADVFIDGMNKQAMSAMINRFIECLFGRADVAPTKAEYGMYAAKSASLRSSDLSRQIGAAIFSVDGELITQGCNEVPRAFGGTYWDQEEPDHRDVKIGYDPNDIHRKEVVRDFLERLQQGGFLSEKAISIGSSAEIVEKLTKKPSGHPDFEGQGILSDASVMDLTEYGRVVHAEMCAICDAARLGKSVKGGVLFTTTFPCHNCTKHILAAGISKVFYIEPYPKSKAKVLHENEVELERASSTRLSFVPFIGISPFRYRDMFEKGKRKRDGLALTWLDGKPAPNLKLAPPTYIDNENYELASLIGHVG